MKQIKAIYDNIKFDKKNLALEPVAIYIYEDFKGELSLIEIEDKKFYPIFLFSPKMRELLSAIAEGDLSIEYNVLKKFLLRELAKYDLERIFWQAKGTKEQGYPYLALLDDFAGGKPRYHFIDAKSEFKDNTLSLAFDVCLPVGSWLRGRSDGKLYNFAVTREGLTVLIIKIAKKENKKEIFSEVKNE